MEDRELSLRFAALCASGASALLALAAAAEPVAEPVTPPVSPEAGAEAGKAAGPGAAAGEATAAPAAVDLHRLHREAAESFYRWDGDRDGSVVELEAMEMTPEAFAAADLDRDGKLSLVEWVDARFAATPAARQAR